MQKLEKRERDFTSKPFGTRVALHETSQHANKIGFAVVANAKGGGGGGWGGGVRLPHARQSCVLCGGGGLVRCAGMVQTAVKVWVFHQAYSFYWQSCRHDEQCKIENAGHAQRCQTGSCQQRQACCIPCGFYSRRAACACCSTLRRGVGRGRTRVACRVGLFSEAWEVLRFDQISDESYLLAR